MPRSNKRRASSCSPAMLTIEAKSHSAAACQTGRCRRRRAKPARASAWLKYIRRLPSSISSAGCSGHRSAAADMRAAASRYRPCLSRATTRRNTRARLADPAPIAASAATAAPPTSPRASKASTRASVCRSSLMPTSRPPSDDRAAAAAALRICASSARAPCVSLRAPARCWPY